MLNDETKRVAREIATFISDHRGIDPVVIDVTGNCSWADCFVIATVNSLGHLRGLTRELWAFLAERNVEVRHRRKSVGDDGWELIDGGDIIIHLMSDELRQFYTLEKLWHESPMLSLTDS